MRVHRYLAIGLLCLAAGCSKPGATAASGAADEKSTPVQVATAEQKTIDRIITAEAVLFPVKQATIVPKISAPVVRFLVQRGDRVREGQLLAVLEHRDLMAAAQESKDLSDQAQAGLTNTTQAVLPEDLTKAQADEKAAKQTLDATQTLYTNRQDLVQQGALAQKLLDDARVSLAQAQSAYDTARKHREDLESVGNAAQVKSAQAQAAAAKAHYEGSAATASYAEIRSPIGGIVADRPVNVGDMASAGSALLSVVDVSRVVARANVPVSEAAFLKAGDTATLSSPAGELQGKVTVVSPAVDANTTTIQVWIEGPNPNATWKPGTTVQVAIDAGSIANAVVIPLSALLSSEEGGDKVMLAGTDGMAHDQDVKTGARTNDIVQIVDGIKPGDKVITQGALGLDDKAKITLGQAEHE